MELEDVRSLVRSLEVQLESRLSTLSVALRGDSLDWHALDSSSRSISATLLELQQANEKLRLSSDFPPRIVRQHATRLSELQQEVARLSTTLNQVRERDQLLDNVHRDIQGPAGGHDEARDYLLQERQRIDRSTSHADEVLQQAIFIRSDLGEQRDMIFDGRSRLGNVLVRFPAVNNLLNKIRSRKNRDTLVLGIVIGLGICFFIWFFLL